MTFADIPAGLAIFLDANTFIYHFVSEPTYAPACTALLDRLERGEIEGWTSSHVLAEVSHRLMTIEACTQFSWPFDGIASRLQKHPQDVQQLTRFREALDRIALLPNRMHSFHSSQDLASALDYSRQYGLLTNDALVVAQMLGNGLTNLASNDADFDRVQGITRYSPG